MSRDDLTATPAVRKSVMAILLFFFLLFPHYSSFVASDETFRAGNSLLSYAFTLIHFVATQALGIVHEAGHGICYLFPCPQGITAAMGTVFQWLFPAGIAWYFWHRGGRFAAAVALFFLGFSMQYTAWYISTAHEGLFLPASRSFLGVDGYHDFNYLFSLAGWVRHDGMISGIVRFLAYTIMLMALIGMILESFLSVPKRV